MRQYGLDYYTSSGLSWDALLKKTNVKLDLLTDYDQHLFIEKGMRDGISMVSKRYDRAVTMVSCVLTISSPFMIHCFCI